MQRQHGIKYSLDVTRCMFSSGNVTERARMGRQACKDQVVVDLFAGIGYFTLPMLVQAGVALALLLDCPTTKALAGYLPW